MAHYRLYHLGDQGRIVKAIDIECGADTEALERARTLSDAKEIEIWEGARRVARLMVKDSSKENTEQPAEL